MVGVTENEFLLCDRIAKVKSVVEKYGEENFYISFSGGKDSCVVSALVDMSIPGNKIPRVFCNTGIEYRMIVDFVKSLNDPRIEIIQPRVPIKPMLERDGYPFKSKNHSQCVSAWRRDHDCEWARKYVNHEYNYAGQQCPKVLKYQFSEECSLKISDKCCENLKEKPIAEWQKANNKPYGILGLMREEGGRRSDALCMAMIGDKLKNFQPLVAVTKQWENWFIEEYGVQICDIYKPPYNLERTGCAGCPFNPHLQETLDMLAEKMPWEKIKCEAVWKPVYAEYRRLGYRLRPAEIEGQMTIDELLNDIKAS